MKASIQIDDEVRAVLQAATIEDCRVTLVGPTLARDLYRRVDKALRALGGKWNRSTRAHVFERDPTSLLRAGVETGAVENRKKAMQFYETPEPLALRMIQKLLLREGGRVLEPSAGRGRLATPCVDRGAVVVTVEIDPLNAECLRDRGLVCIEGDFLAIAPRPEFDAIVMNPPFAGNQAIRHIRHAWDFLKPGGRLVALCDAGALFRASTLERDFQQWLRDVAALTEDLPAGTFTESGTGVAAVLIDAERRSQAAP